MSGRAAQAAAQSDPNLNRGFRRWPAPAIGDAFAPMRAWHAPEALCPRMPLTPLRLQAERAWSLVTRGIAQ